MTWSGFIGLRMKFGNRPL